MSMLRSVIIKNAIANSKLGTLSIQDIFYVPSKKQNLLSIDNAVRVIDSFIMDNLGDLPYVYDVLEANVSPLLTAKTVIKDIFDVYPHDEYYYYNGLYDLTELPDDIKEYWREHSDQSAS